MSIANRLLNIIKTNALDKQASRSASAPLTEQEIAAMLADDSDGYLKDLINSLPQTNVPTFAAAGAKQPLPAHVAAAFGVLGLPPAADMNTVTVAFRQQLQQYHPDKNASADSRQQQQLQSQTADIIKAYTTIKNYFANTPRN